MTLYGNKSGKSFCNGTDGPGAMTLKPQMPCRLSFSSPVQIALSKLLKRLGEPVA